MKEFIEKAKRQAEELGPVLDRWASTATRLVTMLDVTGVSFNELRAEAVAVERDVETVDRLFDELPKEAQVVLVHRLPALSDLLDQSTALVARARETADLLEAATAAAMSQQAEA